LAHDLDVGVRGVSTPCKDTPPRRGIFPEENAVIKSNALPKLSTDTCIKSNQASSDEPPAAPNTVFGRLGAMISPAAKAGITGAFISPRFATFIQRVSTRKTKGLNKNRAQRCLLRSIVRGGIADNCSLLLNVIRDRKCLKRSADIHKVV